jgi:transposase
MTKWKLLLSNAGQSYEDALKNFEGFFQGLFKETENLDDLSNSLTGQIKGVTEETAGLIAGQMTAIRIAQATAETLARRRLEELVGIRNNTSYIERIYNLLNGTSANDIARSQGLS